MGKSVKKILHFSDTHLNISRSPSAVDSASFPIRYDHDSPIRLLESALAYAQHVLPQPDVFLFTGDHVAHGAYSDAYIATALTLNVQTMRKYFGPSETHGREVTAILGNSDANPNYFMEVTNPDSVVNPTITKVARAWDDSLSSADANAFSRRGCLSYPLTEKLVLPTLNTIPYAPKHTPNTLDVADPFGQFAWLSATLASLEKSGKVAYITGHIPPIVDSFREEPQWHVQYIETYKKIIGKHPGVVKAQLFGHVQSIEVRVPPAAPLSSSRSSATDESFELAPLFLAGSISPYFINNPSFVVWDYDVERLDVVDFAVYATNISESDQTLKWQLLFRGSSAYGVKSLSTAELSAFYERMKTDPKLLDAYYWNMKAQSKRFEPCSSDICRAKTLCAIKWWTTTIEYLACVDGVQSSIRDPVSAAAAANSRGGDSSRDSDSANDLDVLRGKTHEQTQAGANAVAIVMSVFAALVVGVVAFAVVRRLRRSRAASIADERDLLFDSVSPPAARGCRVSIEGTPGVRVAPECTWL